MKPDKNLIIVSFLILFLELLLIRLIGTEIRIFAYLSNLLLLSIFISSGLGMFLKRSFSLVVSSVLLLLLVLIIVSGVFVNITDLLAPLSESFIWFQSGGNSILSVVGGIVLTILLLLLIMAIFIPLGQKLGNCFEQRKETIWLYSLNIIFSLLGIWIFNLFSFMSFSPLIGLVLAQILIAVLVPKKQLNFTLVISLMTMVIVIFHLARTPQTYWSPYQKLTLQRLPTDIYRAPGYQLQVNNVGYMGLLNLSKKRQEVLAELLKDQQLPENFDLRFSNQYDLPFFIKTEVKQVLIIGSGGGNDAAGALRAQIPVIDAVEIDPKIVDLGKRYHPEDPYQADQVNVVVDDGRSFFRRTGKKYDLVIMGLADSHTLGSSMTNVQLDNYLYTRESFEEIKSILKPGGVIYLSFDVRRAWIGAKIQQNMADVFGHPPLVFSLQNEVPFSGWGGVVFVQDLEEGAVDSSLAGNPDLAQFIQARQLSYQPADKKMTDDWPYLYLDKPRIPKIHLIVAVILLAILLIVFNTIPRKGKFRWDAFFLGAGFLLYEFQNISKTSLLYGNTWITNLFTISAILILILLANWVAAKTEVNLKLAYSLLLLTFLGQLVIPLSFFNSLPGLAKYVISPLFLNLPLFFSGLIFINFFAKATPKKTFLASNLIGSAAGGILSFLSYAFGIRSLLFISIILYALSSILSPLRQEA